MSSGSSAILLDFTCNYCGHKWTKLIYSKANLKSLECNKCSDTDVKVRDVAETTTDYYAGSPAFPAKDEETADSLFDLYHMVD